MNRFNAFAMILCLLTFCLAAAHAGHPADKLQNPSCPWCPYYTYGECHTLPVGEPLVAEPGGYATRTLYVYNNNPETESYAITVEYTDGDGWITADPSTFTLPVGDDVNVEFTFFAPAEAPSPSMWKAEIVIRPTQHEDSCRIQVCLLVDAYFVYPDRATIATACKRLQVDGIGDIGGNTANAALDFIPPIDPDECADIYLYDGSPVVCRDVDGEEVCYRSVYGEPFTSDKGFRPLIWLSVDSTGNESYTIATAEFSTADTAIRFRVDYIAPKHEDSCGFVIKNLAFWNKTQVPLFDVAVGEYLDWDVPAHPNEYVDESGYDEARNLLFQHGCGFDECDTLAAINRFAGIASRDNVMFKNYMTLELDIYVYSGGPLGNDFPLPPDTIYSLMTNVDGYLTADIDTCEDLGSMVTFGVYDLYPGDTLCATMILATSRLDPDGSELAAEIDKANVFLDDHTELRCYPHVCDCTPGDANNDGSINVGDAVYIINYVFKGGPAPVPYATCNGDANGDCECNIGDAIYIVNIVFLFGPRAVTCEEWTDVCLWPLR